MYTAQTAYEAIRAYFSAPGAVFAMEKGGYACSYRTEAGRKCAVGCLIPDNVYDKTLEGKKIEDIWADEFGNPTVIADLFGGDKDTMWFLSEAQNLHDDMAREGRAMPAFRAALDALASNEGLTTFDEEV